MVEQNPIELIKQLRSITGASFLECRKALGQNDLDIKKSVDYLRKSGIIKAEKKSQRETKEGIVAVIKSTDNKKAVFIRLLSETDFVARNADFHKLAQTILEIALKNFDTTLEELLNLKIDSGESVDYMIKTAIAGLRENIKLDAVHYLSVDKGTIGHYLHGSYAGNQNIGTMGALSLIKHDDVVPNQEELMNFSKKVCMQIVAQPPLAMNEETIPPQIMERERRVQIETAEKSGKPKDIAERISSGRMKAFLEENTLLNSKSMFDPKMTFLDFTNEAKKTIGCDVEVTGYILLTLSRCTKSIKE